MRQPEGSTCVEGQTLTLHVRPPVCAGLPVSVKVSNPIPAVDKPAGLAAKHWCQQGWLQSTGASSAAGRTLLTVVTAGTS